MHSVVSRTRRSEDATTPLRSGLLNPNGGVKTLSKLLDQQRWLMPLLLWLLTLMLWLPGLGNLPLRDWDEGRVATVARSSTSLLPMKWQQPYLNKPPGLHAPMGRLIRAQGEDETLVRLLPALLSTLAGIALGYIALGFLLRTYAHPLVCLTSLSVILLGYLARVRWPLPTGLLALLLGMVLAWGSGLITPDAASWTQAARAIGVHLPSLQLSALWQSRFDLIPWLGVIVPMGLFNLIGSLQNLESAAAAGDAYPTRGSLLVDGCGTLTAAALGSCFPTTLYIGHPGFKALGARSAYSWMNGVVMAGGCLFGLFGVVTVLIPVEAGLAILLYIGLAMASQAFASTPERHGPAVVLGMLPGVAGWGALMLKAGIRAGGAAGDPQLFGPQLLTQLATADIWAAGVFALEQGQIITAMLLSAWLVYAIEGRFLAAACCSAMAALLAWFGVIHAWQFSPGDTVMHLGWGTGQAWAEGYAAITVIVMLARWRKQTHH